MSGPRVIEHDIRSYPQDCEMPRDDADHLERIKALRGRMEEGLPLFEEEPTTIDDHLGALQTVPPAAVSGFVYAGYTTIRQLAEATREQLLLIPNVGEVVVEQLRAEIQMILTDGPALRPRRGDPKRFCCRRPKSERSHIDRETRSQAEELLRQGTPARRVSDQFGLNYHTVASWRRAINENVKYEALP